MGVFGGCRNLTSITLPSNLTTISAGLFSCCSKLKEITIPDKVTSINDFAFYDCLLRSIKIPDSVKNISSNTLNSTYKLKDLTIGGGIKKISYNDVRKCTSLEKLTLREGIESIGSCAFTTQPNLKYVVIPKSVTSIGERAFGFEVYYLDSQKENYSYRYIDGFKLGVYAGTAGEEYAKTFNIPYEILPEHTHSYTSKVTKPATCTEDGVRTYTCECGDSYRQTIPATGHNYSDFVVTKPATCTEDGVKTKTCANCNDKITETIPATGHKSSGWIVDKAASIGVKGSKHKECTVCKKVLETAEIPALSRISISKASVTLSTSTYAYDGKAKKPGVTVKLNGKTLKNGTDYTVSYSSNAKVGTATVKITGKGNYTGSVSKTYSIKNNFKKATVSGISNKSYTGKNITQSITVKYNGKTLKNGTDYTVSYSSNKNIGTVTVKIAGKGSYTGTITKTFKINPAKQEIQKLTAKSKAFFVDWAQKGSATGYEIQYATNSKFTSAKKVTITNNKTDKTTISKLSGNKKYYVRVRSYTTVKGTKYYGAWSASKSVTTKK